MKNCETVSRWLDLLVDGDLGSDEIALAEEHMRSCVACRVDFEGLQAVKRAAALMPSELSPPQDLWQAIQGRLETTRQPRSWLKPAVFAAAATILVTIGLSFLLAPNHSTAPTVGDRQSASPAVHAGFESTPVETFKVEYEQARSDLLTVIESRRDQLSPDTLEVIDRNMRLIDQAIADIEQALISSPGESGLDRQLQLAYRHQIDLLRWAARLSA